MRDPAIMPGWTTDWRRKSQRVDPIGPPAPSWFVKRIGLAGLSAQFIVRTVVFICAVTGSVGTSSAQQNSITPVELHTNQSYLETVARSQPIDITDAMSVFTFVLNALPDEVLVYPTENYYYYRFFHGGIEYAGNLRLDASDRDKGIVHFAYFTAYAPWNDELLSNYKPLTADDGVTVERLDPLSYKISYGGKAVIFNLNDLSHVRPPPGMLTPEEDYLGPVYDESGIQMYLVFNKILNIFHYVLNETEPSAEILSSSVASDRILIGHRTGFAFFSDRFRNRKILIGVYNGNSAVNNYFDGPFDQLPDNFIKGDALKVALEAAFPSIKGKIDRFGNAEGGQNRILITPYIHYDSQYELQQFSDCTAAAADDQSAYYRCFVVDEDELADAAASEESTAQDPVATE